MRLTKNHDIALALGESKSADQILVGFALETDNERKNAIDKIQRKNFDAIVLNSLADKGAGFATVTNKVTIIDRKGEEKAYELKSKSDVANDIIDYISNKFFSD